MKHPKVTVTVELLPIFPANMPEEDRTEERYLEIMKERCNPNKMWDNLVGLTVNDVYWDSTMKAEFPEGWNKE